MIQYFNYILKTEASTVEKPLIISITKMNNKPKLNRK